MDFSFWLLLKVFLALSTVEARKAGWQWLFVTRPSTTFHSAQDEQYAFKVDGNQKLETLCLD